MKERRLADRILCQRTNDDDDASPLHSHQQAPSCRVHVRGGEVNDGPDGEGDFSFRLARAP